MIGVGRFQTETSSPGKRSFLVGRSVLGVVGVGCFQTETSSPGNEVLSANRHGQTERGTMYSKISTGKELRSRSSSERGPG